METIYSTIRKEVKDFIDNQIEVVPGYYFNQYETIKRCHLYLNNRFEDNSKYVGRDKLFFNIVNHRKDAAARFLNLDTKDIRLMPQHPTHKVATMLLQYELKNWLKKNKFDQLLNQLADELPSFGSVVIEKIGKDPRITDLRRLFLDPTAKDIRSSRFVTVKHYLTISDLRKKVSEGWDSAKIEKIIERHKDKQSEAPVSYEQDGQINQMASSPFIEIYTRFGEVDGKLLNQKGKRIVAFAVVACPLDFTTDKEQIKEEGEILYITPWNKPFPYYDFHYRKTYGRWLGVGVVEDLFDAQTRKNEIANQKRVAGELSWMQIFQTADPTVFSNVLENLLPGAIIKTKQPNSLQRVDMSSNQNLSFFQVEDQTYDNLADRLSFANDLVSGQQIAASTPATNAVIQNNNATSQFLMKRQNVANKMREFILESVLPTAVKDLSQEHVVHYMGDRESLQELDELLLTAYWNDEFKKNVLEGDGLIDAMGLEQQQEVKKQELRALGPERWYKTKEKMYNDVEFEFDIMVDNEQEDVAAIASNTLQFATLISSNQAAMEDPVFALLLSESMERYGIDPGKIEMAMAKRKALPQPEMPGMPGQPQAGPVDPAQLQALNQVNNQVTQ